MARPVAPSLLGRLVLATIVAVLVPSLAGCSVLTDFGRFRGPAADAGPDARPDASEDASTDGTPAPTADASTTD